MSVKELNLKNLDKAIELLNNELVLIERRLNSEDYLHYIDKEVRHDYCSLLKQSMNCIQTVKNIEECDRQCERVGDVF